MTPWMDGKDIRLIKNKIIAINKQHISVLEWGSGGSTEHFSKFMSDNNITYDWTSIEYNKEWYDKIVALNIPHAKIVLFDVGNTKLKQRNTNMDEYVAYPMTLNKKFDFILVDGRKRRRCLINASKLLLKDGVVFLHDAQRKYYHCAFKHFSDHKFLTNTLWMGKNV